MENNRAVPDRIQSRRMRIAAAFQHFCANSVQERTLELRDIQSLPQKKLVKMHYDDDAFDWVACYELIETLNSVERQLALTNELFRIARKGIFISTVNRRHPIDMQTGLPFLHWIKSESAGNLLTADDLKKMAARLPGDPHWQLGHIRFAGIKSHFYLMIKKSASFS